MRGHGSKLERLQEQAIAALLEAPDIKTAADRVGIAPDTLRTWMKLPGFKEAYREARLEVVQAAVTRLTGLCGEAIECLRSALTSDNSTAAVRAACAILTKSTEGLELLDLEARITELEQTRPTRREAV